jgi:hypothetical protein
MKKHQLEHRNREQRKPVAIVRDLAPKDARNVVGGWSVPEYGETTPTAYPAREFETYLMKMSDVFIGSGYKI